MKKLLIMYLVGILVLSFGYIRDSNPLPYTEIAIAFWPIVIAYKNIRPWFE